MNRARSVATATSIAAFVFFGHAIHGALTLAIEQAAPAVGPLAVGFPREIPLPSGGMLRIATKPTRIVAASARMLDFCAALLPPECLAGFPEQAIEYATLGDRESAFLGRPRFREYLAEPVMELTPDLVLADPWSSADTKERLTEAGIPVLVVTNSVAWRDMCDVLTLLGKVFGEEQRAAEEIRALELRVERLRERASRAPLRAIPYSSFGAQGFSAGSRTTLDEAMRLAGIVNLVAAAGIEGHVNLTFEQIIAFDPDAIVVSLPLRAELAYTGDKGGASEALLCGEEMLEETRAIRNHRFLRLPAGLYASSSHGIVRAAEVLADERDRLIAEDAGR